ncbi:MAG: (2Fe-2S)-binding protein, partial [Anaerolineales bacterium]|nr:(2Fe-2S)-binding protein [Anaerolineales bacterium]
MASKIATFTLNGRRIEVLVKPLTTVQTLLRDQLGLTSTKAGCKQGGCGSCTVLVNGDPMMSCLLPVEDVQGQEVITLEGLTPTPGLHTIQEVFFENFAIQCGYCTPGMVMVSKALLDRNPRPSREEIIDA